MPKSSRSPSRRRSNETGSRTKGSEAVTTSSAHATAASASSHRFAASTRAGGPRPSAREVSDQSPVPRCIQESVPAQKHSAPSRRVRGHRGQHPHCLVLVGHIRPEFQTIIGRIPALTGRVLFTGFVPGEKVSPILGGADLLFFPSLYEGFGLPIIDAQAVGVAVASSNRGSPPALHILIPHRPMRWARQSINASGMQRSGVASSNAAAAMFSDSAGRKPHDVPTKSI